MARSGAKVARSPDRRPEGSARYVLRCRGCARTFEDDGVSLQCPAHTESALLVAEYEDERFEPDTRAEGVFRYGKWLPGEQALPGAGGGATYKSEKLGRLAGLENLWVSFNGYWPEKGATLQTATFKDLEAWAVLARISGRGGVLVVASAGNTAAALARACTLRKVRCLIVLPKAGLYGLRLPEEVGPSVKIVSLAAGDYSDAIGLADRISKIEGFFPEGGVKNVARRDGLGTTVLNAVETVGEIPKYYFQAVGSGAGGIAAYEAAERLTADGRFGEEPPKLVLSQNLPFAPMHASWKVRRRGLVEVGEDDARRQARQMAAPVLSNRRPAYSVRGGIFDVLTRTGGDVLAAGNRRTLRAKRLFEETEGIDIDPAGAVALATLMEAARRGAVEPEAPVLLNITGGGRRRLGLEKELIQAQPSLELDERETFLDETPERIAALFA